MDDRTISSAQASDIATSHLLAVLLGILGLWLLLHGYSGVVHDAVLYAGTALFRLDPAAMASDFYLAGSANEAFSLFPAIYARAIAALGFETATLLLLGLGQLLWLAGACVLVFSILGRRAALLALLLICVIPGRYGSLDVFSYAEPYLTPRLFAEAAILFALAAFAGQRLIAGTFLALAAALLHPLMALGGWAVIFLLLVLQWPRLIWLAVAGAALAAGLMVAGIEPFDRLARTLDPAWLEVVRFRTPYLFYDSWSYWNWADLGLDLLLLALASLTAQVRQRRLYLAGLIAAVLAHAASFIGTDVFHNVLVAQLQVWRAEWIVRILALTGLAHLLFTLHRSAVASARLPILLLALVAVCMMLGHSAKPMAIMTLLVLLLALPPFRHWYRGERQPLPRPLAGLIIGLAAGLALTVLGTAFGHSWHWRDQLAGVGLSDLQVYGFAWIWIAFAGAIALSAGLFRTGPTSTRIAFALAVVLVLAGSLGWDRRSEWTRALEQERLDISALRDALPVDADIYWERAAVATWLALGRPSYFSQTQGSGAVLDREAALEFERRRGQLNALGTGDFLTPFVEREERNASGHLASAADVRQACGTGDGPDALILSTDVPGLAAVSWQAPVPMPLLAFDEGSFRLQPVSTFYLYLCQEIAVTADTTTR